MVGNSNQIHALIICSMYGNVCALLRVGQTRLARLSRARIHFFCDDPITVARYCSIIAQCLATVCGSRLTRSFAQTCVVARLPKLPCSRNWAKYTENRRPCSCAHRSQPLVPKRQHGCRRADRLTDADGAGCRRAVKQ